MLKEKVSELIKDKTKQHNNYKNTCKRQQQQ